MIIEPRQSRDGKRRRSDLESLVAEHDSVPTQTTIANGDFRAADEAPTDQGRLRRPRVPADGLCVQPGLSAVGAADKPTGMTIAVR
jgi:hypothetical protein